MNSADICRLGSLIYPIMLTQEAGEISEAKAAELLDLDIVTYRETKHAAIRTIMVMVESLPSPLRLLLEGMKDQRASSTKPDGS